MSILSSASENLEHYLKCKRTNKNARNLFLTVTIAKLNFCFGSQ